MKLITTSWDDGHILDLRLAELLDKYKLQGTFYIPRTNSERPVMETKHVRELAKKFEIGGHTIHHVRLTNSNRNEWQKEIQGSYYWLQDVTGKNPVSFCAPGGKCSHTVITEVFKYGYKLIRTTELLSVRISQRVVPTSVQVFHHSKTTYCFHLLKRNKWAAMLQWMKSNSETDLLRLTEYYLQKISASDGCFHLWGHSWEVEEWGLWKKLESIFRVLSGLQGFSYIQNKDLH